MRGMHERRAVSIKAKRLTSNRKGKPWSKTPWAPKVRNQDVDRHRDRGTGRKLSLEQKSFLALHAHVKTTCLV